MSDKKDSNQKDKTSDRSPEDTPTTANRPRTARDTVEFGGGIGSSQRSTSSGRVSSAKDSNKAMALRIANLEARHRKLEALHEAQEHTMSRADTEVRRLVGDVQSLQRLLDEIDSKKNEIPIAIKTLREIESSINNVANVVKKNAARVSSDAETVVQRSDALKQTMDELGQLAMTTEQNIRSIGTGKETEVIVEDAINLWKKKASRHEDEKWLSAGLFILLVAGALIWLLFGGVQDVLSMIEVD